MFMTKGKSLRAVFIFIVLLASSNFCYAGDKTQNEIILQVNPGLIALPPNEAAKIPVDAVRVRSTELRELNQKFNAVWFEKVYRETEKPEGSSLQLKGLKLSSREDSKEPALPIQVVDVSKLITKKDRKELEKDGKSAEQVRDVFLVTFEPKAPVQTSEIAAAYKKLPIVIYADSITRRGNNERIPAS